MTCTKGLERRGPVHLGGPLEIPGDLPEERRQHIDRQRQREGDVGDDQAPPGVEQSAIDRSTLNSGVTSEICGNMATSSDAPTENLLAPEAQPGDGVGGETRQDHGDKSGDQGDDDRVPQGAGGSPTS